ncbi:E3 ubiquitin-protein ligase synoviolin A [Smittium culicis]|uniref:RING-type E3 ubiquitin transferase n=1 Tax=Smittium culicis TaxID=133412 RepID=A0A1R1Y971_9FUNG|nr:E3 ubiquitin-protein ligase synoviolin A [Smittium culicis]
MFNALRQHRFALYGSVSLSIFLFQILKEYARYNSFFPVCVALAQSSVSVLAIFNISVFLLILSGIAVVRLFFTELRPLEVDRLYERAWFSITEICLALTIFKEELNAYSIFLFGILLFVKIFHWLLDDRIEYMEQRPNIDSKLIYKMSILGLILMFTNISMVLYAYNFYRIFGAKIVVIFGFEYALLAINLMISIIKFIFSCIDNFQEREWQNKTIYLFYIELFSDLLKLAVYSGLFYVLVQNYGLPLHIIRDIYLTVSSFVSKCKDWIRYRKAMKYMDDQYATLNQAQLDALTDKVCIICREEIAIVQNSPDVPKRLSCGHVFHFYCLRSWLARQQSCPTCRTPVLETANPPNTPINNNQVNPNQNINPTPNTPITDNQSITPNQNLNQTQNIPNLDNSNPPLTPDSAPIRPQLPHEYISSSQNINKIKEKILSNDQNLSTPSSPHAHNLQTPSDNNSSIPNSSANPSSSKAKPSTSIPQINTNSFPSTSLPSLIPISNNSNSYISSFNPIPNTFSSQQHTNTQFPQFENNFSLLNNLNNMGSPLLVPLSTPAASLDPQNPNIFKNILSMSNMQLPNLDSLSDEQIENLNKSTREAVQERLRILAYVQLQLQNLNDILSQLNSC